MRDTLPPKIRKRECRIIHLDISFGEGTHWTAYAKNYEETIFYDSYGFSLSGNSSILCANFNPALYLSSKDDYEIVLSNFETFNVIPNIDETHNQFVYENGSLRIPTGAFEINNFIEYINKNKPS